MVNLPVEVNARVQRISTAVKARRMLGQQFADDCASVRQWAKWHLHDGCDGTDRNARNILAGLVGGHVVLYVQP